MVTRSLNMLEVHFNTGHSDTCTCCYFCDGDGLQARCRPSFQRFTNHVNNSHSNPQRKTQIYHEEGDEFSEMRSVAWAQNTQNWSGDRPEVTRASGYDFTPNTLPAGSQLQRSRLTSDTNLMLTARVLLPTAPERPSSLSKVQIWHQRLTLAAHNQSLHENALWWNGSRYVFSTSTECTDPIAAGWGDRRYEVTYTGVFKMAAELPTTPWINKFLLQNQ